MTEDELKAILAGEISRADQRVNGLAGTERAELLQHYLADPDAGKLKDRPADRSAVVSPDVRNTVETAMPQLMKVFTSGDRVCVFNPHGVEDIKAAEQETEAVNHVVMTDNPGFLILHTVFKDAALSRLGIGMVDWDNSEIRERESSEGLSPDEYALILQQNDTKIVEHTERQSDPPKSPEEQAVWTPTVHDVTVVRTRRVDKVRIETIAPENFGYAPRTKDINSEDGTFFYYRDDTQTRSDLIAAGYTKALIDTIPATNAEQIQSPEAQVRYAAENNLLQGPNNLDEQGQPVTIFTCFPLVDFDGDGIAERRKVVLAGGSGSNGVMLSNDPVDGHPFFALTPILIPHMAEGLSLADLAKDTQIINSVLDRLLLDNAFMALNSRIEVPEAANDGANTIDDLLVPRPGAIVRTAQGGLLKPIPVPDVSGGILGVRQFVENQGENRTGITRYNQGLDANSLNKTATGVSLIQNASMMRLELVARVYAETGVKRLFLLVHDLLRKHSVKAWPLRMQGAFVPVDPRKWARRLDMTVTVGLGTGNTQQRAAMFNQLLQRQEAIVQAQGGPNGPLVTMSNIYNALKAEATLMQVGAPETFYTDPAQAPPQQPKPDPKMQEAQANLQIKQQESQAQLALEQQKMQMQAHADAQRAAQDSAAKAQQAQADMAIAQQRAALDAHLAREKANNEIELAWLKARADIEIKKFVAESTAAAGMVSAANQPQSAHPGA